MTKESEQCLRLPLLTAHTNLMLLKPLQQQGGGLPPYDNTACVAPVHWAPPLPASGYSRALVIAPDHERTSLQNSSSVARVVTSHTRITYVLLWRP